MESTQDIENILSRNLPSDWRKQIPQHIIDLQGLPGRRVSRQAVSVPFKDMWQRFDVASWCYQSLLLKHFHGSVQLSDDDIIVRDGWLCS